MSQPVNLSAPPAAQSAGEEPANTCKGKYSSTFFYMALALAVTGLALFVLGSSFGTLLTFALFGGTSYAIGLLIKAIENRGQS